MKQGIVLCQSSALSSKHVNLNYFKTSTVFVLSCYYLLSSFTMFLVCISNLYHCKHT